MPLAIPPGSSRTPGARTMPRLAVEAAGGRATRQARRRGRPARGRGGERVVDVGARRPGPRARVAGALELAEQRRVDEPAAARRPPTAAGGDRAPQQGGGGHRRARVGVERGSARCRGRSARGRPRPPRCCEWMPSASASSSASSNSTDSSRTRASPPIEGKTRSTRVMTGGWPGRRPSSATRARSDGSAGCCRGCGRGWSRRRRGHRCRRRRRRHRRRRTSPGRSRSLVGAVCCGACSGWDAAVPRPMDGSLPAFNWPARKARMMRKRPLVAASRGRHEGRGEDMAKQPGRAL